MAAVAAAAVLMSGISVSAADWSQATYSDGDPSTVKIISTDENGVDFCNSATNTDICKVRITLDKVLKNREDYSKIATMKWKVTYKGVSDALTTDALSGGTYMTNNNSTGYSIRSENYDEENEKAIWANSTYEQVDFYNVPEDMPLEKDGELVFMDWSFADITNQGVTVRISDLEIYDKDNNPIEQLGYKEWTPEMSADVIDTGAGNPTHKGDEEKAEEAPEEAEPVEEDAPAEESAEEAEPVEETPAAEEETPVEPESIEEVPKTGDTGIFVALGALAVAAGALTVTSKRKQ